MGGSGRAAKTTFVKSANRNLCGEGDEHTNPPAGAAKSSFMTECEKDA
jgi:hypothetical protein